MRAGHLSDRLHRRMRFLTRLWARDGARAAQGSGGPRHSGVRLTASSRCTESVRPLSRGRAVDPVAGGGDCLEHAPCGTRGETFRGRT